MTDETVEALLRFLSHPVTVVVLGIAAATAGASGVVLNLIHFDTLRSMRELRPRNLAFSLGVLAVLGGIRGRSAAEERDARHTAGLVLGAVGGLIGLILLLADWIHLALTRG